MQVTSLYDLRQQLAAWLEERLAECDILPGLPDLRRPLTAERCTLVLTVQKLSRCEGTAPGGALTLEVTLGMTVCHPDSSSACEELTEQLAVLVSQGDLPCRVAALECEAAEYNRTRGVFLQRMTLTLYCRLSDREEAEE